MGRGHVNSDFGLDVFLLTGFLHTDIQPSWLAPIGAWIYHRARMRRPLARHDGTMSAIRAHPASVLIDTATQMCPALDIHIYNRGVMPLLNVFHSLVGTRPDISRPFMDALQVRGMGLAPGMGTWHSKDGTPWSDYLAELNHAAGVLVKPYALRPCGAFRQPGGASAHGSSSVTRMFGSSTAFGTPAKPALKTQRAGKRADARGVQRIR